MSRKTSSFTHYSPPASAVHTVRGHLGKRTSHYLLGTALSVGLLAMAAVSSPAEAAMIKLGNVDVQIDTTLSFGVSQRITERETKLLPARNGGPADTTAGGNGENAGSFGVAKRLFDLNTNTYDDDDDQGTDPVLRTDDDRDATQEGLMNALLAANGGMDVVDAANGDFTPADAEGNALSTTVADGETMSPRAMAQAAALMRAGAGIFNCGTASNPNDAAQAAGAACMYDNTFLSGAGSQENYNYDSSINNDDGRLNFDDGDIIAGTFKGTVDVEASLGNGLTLFARSNVFYDAIMDDEDSFERSQLGDSAEAAVIRDVDMLDFYVDYDADLGNKPVLIRVGRQVINWGEATFILGGNSVFNSIDVAAFRRPGAEIKEALLPIEAIYGSVALTDNTTLEAYVGGWKAYQLDSAGTPFAHSDAFEGHSLGNDGRFYVGSGAYSGSGRRNCLAPANIENDATRHFAVATNNVFGTCTTSDLRHFNSENMRGNVEASRNSIANRVVAGRDEAGYVLRDTDFLSRGEDEEPDRGLTDDAHGLAFRWYAENLNSTEFGFYYQNYTSRIPYASSIARRPVWGPNVATPTWSSTLRGASLKGCFATLASNTFAGFSRGINTGTADAPEITANGATMRPVVLNDAQLRNITPSDPTGLGAELRSLFGTHDHDNDPGTAEVALQSRTDIIAAAAPNVLSAIQRSDRVYLGALTEVSEAVIAGPDGDPNEATDNGTPHADITAAIGHLNTIVNDGLSQNDGETDAAFAHRVAVKKTGLSRNDGETDAAFRTRVAEADNSAAFNERARLARRDLNRLNDANTAANNATPNSGNISTQSIPVLSGVLGNAINSALAKPNGSIAQNADLACIGQFAQSIGGSLVPTGANGSAIRYQTEIVAEYPEDIELYGFSFNTTAFGWGVQGELAYRPNMPLQLDADAMSITALAASCAWENFNAVAEVYYGLQTVKSVCGQWDQVFHGYIREQVFNFDIGTTATFTRSNPVVAFLGADLGILLTEIGYVNMPDADYYKQAAPDVTGIPRLANQCTSGSDLPLGGVFSLDPRTAEDCRPTEESSGLVLFGQLQYNNVFGTPIALRPTIAYSVGLDGRAPSPAATFIEDNESLSLSISAEYQSAWTARLGVTMYDGETLYNRNVDRDFASLSVSYAF